MQEKKKQKNPPQLKKKKPNKAELDYFINFLEQVLK